MASADGGFCPTCVASMIILDLSTYRSTGDSQMGVIYDWKWQQYKHLGSGLNLLKHIKIEGEKR